MTLTQEERETAAQHADDLEAAGATLSARDIRRLLAALGEAERQRDEADREAADYKAGQTAALVERDDARADAERLRDLLRLVRKAALPLRPTGIKADIAQRIEGALAAADAPEAPDE